MTELLLAALLGVTTAGLVPLAIWSAHLRRRLRDAVSQNTRLEADLQKRSTDLAYFEARTTTLAADRTRLEAERDQFRSIAATRTLPQPEALPAPVRTLAPIWEDRVYANHPTVNLARLAEDLAGVDSDELLLTVRLAPQGGWTRKLREPPARTYSGSRDRILEDLRCWLMDDDLRLVERRSEGVAWSDPDSPLHFHVSVAQVTWQQPQVHVHPVEVAVVETQVVERFVEQPVVIEVPTLPGSTSPAQVQVGLSREEVLALFEVELTSKLAELGIDPETGPVQPATHAVPLETRGEDRRPDRRPTVPTQGPVG